MEYSQTFGSAPYRVTFIVLACQPFKMGKTINWINNEVFRDFGVFFGQKTQYFFDRNLGIFGKGENMNFPVAGVGF